MNKGVNDLYDACALGRRDHVALVSVQGRMDRRGLAEYTRQDDRNFCWLMMGHENPPCSLFPIAHRPSAAQLLPLEHDVRSPQTDRVGS